MVRSRRVLCSVSLSGALTTLSFLCRSWLFAMTNVVRIFVARKWKLENFQLSQSYLYFYDHLGKAPLSLPA
jgi:aminopeptidase C